MAGKTREKATDSIDYIDDSDTTVMIDTDVENANLDLYNRVRVVPAEAQKEIKGGRLNGFTDINPMYRIKTLTENFGICGYGWYYDIVKTWIEQGANGEIAAFVEINLYIKIKDEWSRAIKGIGGSSFVSNESKGLHTSDECFKMALTDSISVACKALGFCADIYYAKDRSKYDKDTDTPDTPTPSDSPAVPNSVKGLTPKQINRLHAIRNSVSMDEDTLKRIMLKHFKKDKSEELTKSEYDFICGQLEAMKNQQKNPA
jgi:hypothetical protein